MGYNIMFKRDIPIIRFMWGISTIMFMWDRLVMFIWDRPI